jgi:hypothetical protein
MSGASFGYDIFRKVQKGKHLRAGVPNGTPHKEM